MKSEELKARLTAMLNDYYTPKRKIALLIGVPTNKAYYKVSRWLNDACYLSDSEMMNLNKLLISKGY